MAHKAEGTAQPHVLAVRPFIGKLLPDPSKTVTPRLPKFKNRPFTDKDMNGIRAELKAFASLPKTGGWRYELNDGQLVTRFDNPLRWNVVEKAFYDGMIENKQNAGTSPFVAKYEGKVALQKDGDGVGDNDSHERADIIAGRVTLLTKTSKMGCYSWNLPAGPPFKDGTCPGSQMAFYVEPKGEKKTDRKARIMGALERAKSNAVAAYAASVPGGIEEAIDRFICNGCYAMKGAYGNPSVITIMEWRRRWLKEFAMLPEKAGGPTRFEKIMIFCIRLAQYKSKQALKKRSSMTPEQIAAVPHPDYFRIHDSGDMWSDEYFQAWLSICRQMPDIHFWAPTRMWVHESNSKFMYKAIKEGKIPKNLALRPSGLFFDGPEPVIVGLTAGTSSSTITYGVSRDKIKLAIEASDQNAWGCPAYLPEVLGGGAFPKTRPLPDNPRSFLVVEGDSKALRNVATKYANAVVKQVLLRQGVKGKPSRQQKEEAYKAIGDQAGHFVTAFKKGVDPVIVAQFIAPPRKVRSNPAQQSYAMYPKVDESTPENKDFVFYQALFDPRTQQYIIDPSTGRPMTAIEKHMKLHPNAISQAAQTFQAAGSCSVARDPNHAQECRVCWNTTDHKRAESMKRLPVVYAKH